MLHRVVSAPCSTAIARARAHAATPRPTPYRDERRHLQKLRQIARRFPFLEEDCPLGVEALAKLGRLGVSSVRHEAARGYAERAHRWKRQSARTGKFK